MSEYINLSLHIKECEDRIEKLLSSSTALLEKAVQLQQYIIACRKRQAEILGEKNGERRREKTTK